MRRLLQNITFLLLGSILIISCEGYRCANGVIYDSVTDLPIDSVQCKVLSGSDLRYSDSLGNYNVCNDFNGCVPECSDILVEFSKFGYITRTILNPEKNDIFLDRE